MARTIRRATGRMRPALACAVGEIGHQPTALFRRCREGTANRNNRRSARRSNRTSGLPIGSCKAMLPDMS